MLCRTNDGRNCKPLRKAFYRRTNPVVFGRALRPCPVVGRTPFRGGLSVRRAVRLVTRRVVGRSCGASRRPSCRRGSDPGRRGTPHPSPTAGDRSARRSSLSLGHATGPVAASSRPAGGPVSVRGRPGRATNRPSLGGWEAGFAYKRGRRASSLLVAPSGWSGTPEKSHSSGQVRPASCGGRHHSTACSETVFNGPRGHSVCRRNPRQGTTRIWVGSSFS
jgi:hypothetical protein